MKKRITYQSRVNIAAAVAILSIFLIVFQFFFLEYKLRREAITNSRYTALLVSKEITNSIQLYFRDALILTTNYANNFLVYKKNKIPRGNIYQLLKSSLVQNNKFLAIWTMWEPNAYDNSDKFYANDSIHDPNGSFSIAYYYDNGIIKTEINDTADYREDFYTEPKKQRHTLIIDPFDYQYHGNSKFFYETSLIQPIIENGTFLGVIGIDIDLDNLLEQYKNIRVYSNGYISLLSNSGQIVTHSNLKYVRRNINDIFRGKNTFTLDSMKAGKTFVTETLSEFTGKKVMRFFFPINLEYSPLPWYIMVETPMNEIMVYSRRFFIVSSIMLAVSLIVLIYLIFNSVDLRKKERMLLLALNRAESSEEELKTYQGQLERLVQERTEEYNCANEELNAVNEELHRYKTELEILVEQRTLELKESEAKFRSIFNISPDAIYIGVQDALY
jgi:methyl-accepting chemotaxis protein